MSCRIEITDKSGKTFSHFAVNPKGHPSNPMTDAEIDKKFLELARGVLKPAQAAEALRVLWHVDELDHAAKIFDVVRIQGS